MQHLQPITSVAVQFCLCLSEPSCASASWGWNRGERSGGGLEASTRFEMGHTWMDSASLEPEGSQNLSLLNSTCPNLLSPTEAPRQVSFGFSRKGSRWPANAEQKPGPGSQLEKTEGAVTEGSTGFT